MEFEHFWFVWDDDNRKAYKDMKLEQKNECGIQCHGLPTTLIAGVEDGPDD